LRDNRKDFCYFRKPRDRSARHERDKGIGGGVPEMDIRWPEAAGFDFLWLQILGYMGWPHNEAERSARIARYFAEQLASLGTRKAKESKIEKDISQLRLEKHEPDRFRSSAMELDRKYVEPARHEVLQALGEFGWFRALLSAPGNSPFPLAEVVTAGRILVTVRSTEVRYPELRGGSVKKAAFLLEHSDGRNGLIIRNERDIRRAWAKFKDIAHLAAAFVLTDISRQNKDSELEELLVFLTIAREFERFGESFYPHAQKKPLLDPGKMWSVPKYLPLPDPTVPVAPPLHENDLATLRRYHIDSA
jgi:hypothetical protein